MRPQPCDDCGQLASIFLAHLACMHNICNECSALGWCRDGKRHRKPQLTGPFQKGTLWCSLCKTWTGSNR